MFPYSCIAPFSQKPYRTGQLFFRYISCQVRTKLLPGIFKCVRFIIVWLTVYNMDLFLLMRNCWQFSEDASFPSMPDAFYCKKSSR